MMPKANSPAPLDTSDWKPFQFTDLFVIKKGKRLTKANMVHGETPFIGSIDKNNGVSAYINQMPLHKGNTITVNYNGSVGEAFYQPVPFQASDDVNVLYPLFKLTPSIALFIITIIKREKYRFNYGRKWHKERMEQSLFHLPADKNGLPDYVFMEKYINSLSCRAYLDYDVTQPISSKKYSFDTKKWGQFSYSDLFDIERGRGPRKKDLSGKGKTPFITSIDSNNGLTNFTTMKPCHPGNTISVNRNGSVALAFYQPLPFCSTEDVHIFRPKFTLTPYIGLFLATLICREKYRFGYGRKWGIERMKISTIRLPINAKGVPDWAFMENFIKSLPYSSQVGTK
jgi:hypothetical protein